MDSEIDVFIGRYDEEIARQARAARRKPRKLFPGSYELVYDNYNGLVSRTRLPSARPTSSAPSRSTRAG